MRKKITTILFDLDGTLIEPELDFFFEEAARLIPLLGLPPLSPQQLADYHSNGSTFDFVPPAAREEFLKLFWTDFRFHLHPHPRVLPGIEEMLVSMKTAGYKAAITTARSQEVGEIRDLLIPTGIPRSIDLIFSLGPDSFSHRDKCPIAIEAMRALHSDPDETMIVGDSSMDIFTGKRCGVAQTVAVLSGGHSRKVIESLGPDHILTDATELPPLLNRLNGRVSE